MIIRARAVVTMDGAPIEDGAVAVIGNRIRDVGTWREVEARNGGRIRDLGDCVLLPGLINAHCHLDYTGLRGAIAPQRSFAAWIEAINKRKSSLTPDDYVRAIGGGFAEAARFGTTTVANLEAFPELLARIAPPPIRTWWFAEMIDVRAPIDIPGVCEQLAVAGEKGWLGGVGLAPHAPFTGSAELYREATSTAVSHQLRLTTHLAESREETLMFREASGPLFDFMERIGRPMNDCGAKTPLALMLHRGVLDARWIVAHLNELTADDFRLLQTTPKFHIVHCPRSHVYFAHTPFAFAKLKALGFNICVGTDSLASNETLSLFAEMRQLSKNEPALAPRDLLALVTVNAAFALGQEQAIGRVRAGYLADVIALPFTSKLPDVFEEIVAFDGAVPWVLVDGKELAAS